MGRVSLCVARHCLLEDTVLIRGLRGKLENNPSNPKYLKTHALLGYYFQGRDALCSHLCLL
jgi:hypothetical protein